MAKPCNRNAPHTARSNTAEAFSEEGNKARNGVMADGELSSCHGLQNGFVVRIHYRGAQHQVSIALGVCCPSDRQ